MKIMSPDGAIRAAAGIFLLIAIFFFQPKDRYIHCNVQMGLSISVKDRVMCTHPISEIPITVYIDVENPPKLGQRIRIIEKTVLFVFKQYEQVQEVGSGL